MLIRRRRTVAADGLLQRAPQTERPKVRCPLSDGRVDFLYAERVCHDLLGGNRTAYSTGFDIDTSVGRIEVKFSRPYRGCEGGRYSWSNVVGRRGKKWDYLVLMGIRRLPAIGDSIDDWFFFMWLSWDEAAGLLGTVKGRGQFNLPARLLGSEPSAGRTEVQRMLLKSVVTSADLITLREKAEADRASHGASRSTGATRTVLRRIRPARGDGASVLIASRHEKSTETFTAVLDSSTCILALPKSIDIENWVGAFPVS